MKKTALFIFSVMFILGACAQPESQHEQKGVIDLSAVEFAKAIKAVSAVQIVDVRTPREFINGYIKTAFNCDINGRDFENQIATLDKTEPVYIYCLSGARSAAAAKKMYADGFQEVYNMQGGMIQWRAQGLPEVNLKRSSMSGMSMKQFKEHLSSEKSVLVDFYADWCAPCKKMAPFIEEIALNMKDKVEVLRIDVDENQALTKSLGISALPVLHVYKDKELAWSHTGYIGKEDLLERARLGD